MYQFFCYGVNALMGISSLFDALCAVIVYLFMLFLVYVEREGFGVSRSYWSDFVGTEQATGSQM